MSKPLDNRPGAGCIFALSIALGGVALAAVTMYRLAEQGRERSERRRAEWRAESLAKVKAGDNGSGIFVFEDGRLIEMLAGDPDCVANLTTLRLDMADLTGSETAFAAKLVNVKKVTFYSCSGAGNLLAAMKGSAAVEEISFDTTLLPDRDATLLSSFPNLKRVRFAYISEPSKAKSIREDLPGVEVQIDELGEGAQDNNTR